jgi:hypothetical protein
VKVWSCHPHWHASPESSRSVAIDLPQRRPASVHDAAAIA